MTEGSRVMEWMPIESVPKDHGKWIIGLVNGNVEPICWIDYGANDPAPYSGWAYAGNRWGGVLYEGWNELEGEPTDWMPLPPPPTGDE